MPRELLELKGTREHLSLALIIQGETGMLH